MRICRYVHTCVFIRIYTCAYSHLYPNTCNCTNIRNACKYTYILLFEELHKTKSLFLFLFFFFLSAAHYYFDSIGEGKVKKKNHYLVGFFFLWKSWGWEIAISIHLISQPFFCQLDITSLVRLYIPSQGRRMVPLIPCQPGRPGVQPFHRCPFIGCICPHIPVCQLALSKLAGSVHNLRLLASRLQPQCTGF